jgi:hypothetical protein
MVGMDSGLTEKLDALGFREGCIAEVVLVTVNPDGSPNAAPMGAKRTGGTVFEFKPFKTSATYRNLLRDPRSTMNVTSDPAVFLATAFKDEIPNQPVVESLRLRDCDASITCERIEGVEFSPERHLFKNEAKDMEVHVSHPRVFSRGVAEAVEAVIHATRVKAFRLEGRREDADALEKKLLECIGVVRRVSAGGSPEAQTVDTLERMLDGWRSGAWR